MKVKTINRNENEYTKERSEDVQKVHRNLDPVLHPFEKAKEYTRALNAAKTERMFAKPFLCSLTHDEAVYSLAKNPKRLNCMLAGCGDGIIKLWDVAERRCAPLDTSFSPSKNTAADVCSASLPLAPPRLTCTAPCRCLRRLVGHTREVKGLAIAPDGESAVSCSADCTIKLWKVPHAPFEAGGVQADAAPVAEYVGKNAFLGVDYHAQANRFATCGSDVSIWDAAHSDPIHTFSWGDDSVLSVKFNPVRTPPSDSSCCTRVLVLLPRGAYLEALLPRGRYLEAVTWRLSPGGCYLEAVT